MQAPLKTHYSEIDKSTIRIEQEDILKLLGNQQGEIDMFTTQLVDQYIGECLQVSTPSAAFVLSEVTESGSSFEISIPELTFQSGKIIRKMLQHSTYYALFLVTAGPEPEKLVKTLMEQGSFLEGYITDLVASALVEAVADQLEDEIRNLAGKQGMNITNRYSPGYCSWEVEEQQKLFSLFPKKCCGISLSESSLMNPVKSASGIIGLGSKVEYRDYTCEICSMKECMFRKARPT